MYGTQARQCLRSTAYHADTRYPSPTEAYLCHWIAVGGLRAVARKPHRDDILRNIRQVEVEAVVLEA